MPEPIHFSHANSFPASSYRKLFAALAPEFEVGYIETLGHDPRYPVSDGWPHLVQQTLDYITLHYREPVIGVGHSLGGFLTFLSAVARPELFKAIVLLDSPIFGRRMSTLLYLSKRLGIIEHVTPGRGARARRNDWPDLPSAMQHFAEKALFRALDPDCLCDYVTYGTVEHNGRRRLLFQPDIEYQIYCGLPHDFPRHNGRLQVPAGFIGGRRSNVIYRSDLRHMRQNLGMVLQSFDGSHLFPLEKPQATADAIRLMLTRLRNS